MVSAWLTGVGQGAGENISARKWWELYCCSLNNLSNMLECSCGSFADSQITAYNPWTIYLALIGVWKVSIPSNPYPYYHSCRNNSPSVMQLRNTVVWAPFGASLPYCHAHSALCQRWRGLGCLDLSQPSLIRSRSSILAAVPQKRVSIEDGSTSKPLHRVFTYLLWL